MSTNPVFNGRISYASFYSYGHLVNSDDLSEQIFSNNKILMYLISCY